MQTLQSENDLYRLRMFLENNPQESRLLFKLLTAMMEKADGECVSAILSNNFHEATLASGRSQSLQSLTRNLQNLIK